jgi:predicted NUDIX family phosphoesterase
VAEGATERVLVVSTNLLWGRTAPFEGFTTEVGRFLPWLLDLAGLEYRDRAGAESDPSYKQLIPYVVLRCRDAVFHYRRGAAGTEVRLRTLRSLGVGGHVCEEDGTDDPYRMGMLRELAEEVELGAPFAERVVGLINEDRTAVGRVHLGIVHLLDLHEPRVGRRDAALADCGFAPLRKLREARGEFESWSQLLLDAGVLDAAR